MPASSMRCIDSRRLTGPNLLWNSPGAVIDVRFGDADPDRVVATWEHQVRRMLGAVGWADRPTCVRRFAGGASLAISAPVDALYAATDINDWAWDATREVIEYDEQLPVRRAAQRLHEDIEDETRPDLRILMEAARERGLPVVVDADDVSIGLGCGSRTWPVGDVPAPGQVDWGRLHAIPLGLVTGTNGKTTTVRLLGAIGRRAGLVTGISSTDWIAIGDEIVERDDYAGPGGARRVLRDSRTELAVLETARGGLLRRGLAMERADAALITNVAADHLGEFGVENVAELADVKWVVTRALAGHGRAVLNADEDLLVARARDCDFDIIWFSTDPDNPLLRSHTDAGGTVCTVRDGRIVVENHESRDVVGVDAIPITLEGAAVHNVANALGATGLSLALGLPVDAIREGLCSFQHLDNPGRGNLYEINGARILVDFAHNPHGMQAFVELARRLPARRRMLVIGQAGDRSDDDIRELVRAANTVDFDRVLIKRLAGHSRGRPDSEVAGIIRHEFERLGKPADCLVDHELEIDAVRAAVNWAGEGDLVVLLVHEDRNTVLEYLRGIQGGDGSPHGP